MSELIVSNENVLVRHVEDEKYAYYHVKSPEMKVILIHDFEMNDVKTLIKNVENKEGRELPLLVVVDKTKETQFNNLAKIEEFCQKCKTPTVKSPPQFPYEDFLIKNIPNFDDLKVVESYKHSNPHRNNKSHNCKIRRK